MPRLASALLLALLARAGAQEVEIVERPELLKGIRQSAGQMVSPPGAPVLDPPPLSEDASLFLISTRENPIVYGTDLGVCGKIPPGAKGCYFPRVMPEDDRIDWARGPKNDAGLVPVWAWSVKKSVSLSTWIAIDKEYPEGSCMNTVTRTHELIHARDWTVLFRAWNRDMAEVLGKSNRTEPRTGTWKNPVLLAPDQIEPHRKAVEKKLNGVYLWYLREAPDSFLSRVKKAGAVRDSQENYAEDTAKCR